MINKIVQVTAFIALLIGSFILGLLSKPTEMGLFILAAAIALAFSNIEKIKRFKGAGFEAEMLERKVGAMIAKEAEPEAEDEQSMINIRGYGLDEHARLVLTSLGGSEYTWRTIRGISRDSKQSPVSVRQAINWLEINGLVVQAGKVESTYWALSEEGRKLYNNIKAPERAE